MLLCDLYVGKDMKNIGTLYFCSSLFYVSLPLSRAMEIHFFELPKRLNLLYCRLNPKTIRLSHDG